MKKKIKLILFDFNGVFVVGDHKQTSKYFGKKHHTSWTKVYDILYTKYFNQIVENKISEKDGWINPIKELGWQQDWREMRIWHLEHNKTRKTVANYILQLRSHGYKCVLLSKNLISWFSFFEKKLKFKKYFDDVINSQSLDLPKASKETMKYICHKYNVKPKEIIYIDDQRQNLKAPKEMGIKTHFYNNFIEMKKFIKKYTI